MNTHAGAMGMTGGEACPHNSYTHLTCLFSILSLQVKSMEKTMKGDVLRWKNQTALDLVTLYFL